MSYLKAPASLRGPLPSALRNRRTDASHTGLLTAALIVAAGHAPAFAQSTAAPATSATPSTAAPASPASAPSGPDKLPAVTVEAPAQKRPVSTPKTAVAKPSPAPVKAAPAQAPAAAATGSANAAGVAPGGNPYGDPAAAYKVDRSAQTKLTEPILDTPRTITTISKEVIEDKGTTSIRDLARTTPGVTLGTGEGGNPFGDRLFIRGFDARNDAYINGIRDPGAPLRENFNIEQVEILKGPSATIGGRGTSGGAVNVVTKQPGDQDYTKATATLGTDSTVRGSIDANKVYSKELSARVNGMWQEAGVAGRDEAVFDNRWGGAVAIAWRPTQAFKLNFDYSHLSLDQMPDWGVPWDTVLARPITESGLGVNRTNFYGYPARDFQKGEQDQVTIGMEAKLNALQTFSSKMRFGSTVIDYIASAPERLTRVGSDPSTWTVTGNPKSRFQENETVANQTDLTSKFMFLGARHTLVTGFEFSREGIDRTTYTGLVSELVGTPVSSSGAITLSLLNPDNSIGYAGTPIRSLNAAKLTVNTQSVYALDTIKLNPQWIITAGLRLDNYNLDFNQLGDNGTTSTNLSRSDLMLNYNAGITYKPLPNGSIYAAYGTSSNPVGNEVDGSGQGYGGISAGSQLLDPEENTSLEFGTKWELFNRHILATASAFQTEKSNAREAAGQLVYSTGKYRVQGIEVGLGGNITDAFSLYGGAVWMDSEALESRVATDVGKRFANIAHESFNLLAKYKVTDWMSVGGQVTYRGQINGGTLAALTNHVNEFWRFDASAEFQLSKNFALRLQGINLTDELYYDALYRSGTPFVYVAPGRAGYVTLEAKF